MGSGCGSKSSGAKEGDEGARGNLGSQEVPSDSSRRLMEQMERANKEIAESRADLQRGLRQMEQKLERDQAAWAHMEAQLNASKVNVDDRIRRALKEEVDRERSTVARRERRAEGGPSKGNARGSADATSPAALDAIQLKLIGDDVDKDLENDEQFQKELIRWRREWKRGANQVLESPVFRGKVHNAFHNIAQGMDALNADCFYEALVYLIDSMQDLFQTQYCFPSHYFSPRDALFTFKKFDLENRGSLGREEWEYAVRELFHEEWYALNLHQLKQAFRRKRGMIPEPDDPVSYKRPTAMVSVDPALFDQNDEFQKLVTSIKDQCELSVRSIVGTPSFRSEMEEGFRAADTDGSGSIEFEELFPLLVKSRQEFVVRAMSAGVFGHLPTFKMREEAERKFVEFDVNRDGRLNRQEYEDLFKAFMIEQMEQVLISEAATKFFQEHPTSVVTGMSGFSRDETPILEYGNEVAFFNQVELRKESIVESLRKILDSKRFRASVEELFRQSDLDHDSFVSEKDFLAILDRMWRPLWEIHHVLGEETPIRKPSKAEAKFVFHQFDRNEDGFLQWDEFLPMLQELYTRAAMATDIAESTRQWVMNHHSKEKVFHRNDLRNGVSLDQRFGLESVLEQDTWENFQLRSLDIMAQTRLVLKEILDSKTFRDESGFLFDGADINRDGSLDERELQNVLKQQFRRMVTSTKDLGLTIPLEEPTASFVHEFLVDMHRGSNATLSRTEFLDLSSRILQKSTEEAALGVLSKEFQVNSDARMVQLEEKRCYRQEITLALTRVDTQLQLYFASPTFLQSVDDSFAAADQDGDGCVSFSELLEHVRLCLDKFISVADVLLGTSKVLLHIKLPSEESVEELMRGSDGNHDGHLQKHEFASVLRQVIRDMSTAVAASSVQERFHSLLEKPVRVDSVEERIHRFLQVRVDLVGNPFREDSRFTSELQQRLKLCLQPLQTWFATSSFRTEVIGRFQDSDQDSDGMVDSFEFSRLVKDTFSGFVAMGSALGIEVLHPTRHDIDMFFRRADESSDGDSRVTENEFLFVLQEMLSRSVRQALLQQITLEWQAKGASMTVEEYLKHQQELASARIDADSNPEDFDWYADFDLRELYHKLYSRRQKEFQLFVETDKGHNESLQQLYHNFQLDAEQVDPVHFAEAMDAIVETIDVTPDGTHLSMAPPKATSLHFILAENNGALPFARLQELYSQIAWKANLKHIFLIMDAAWSKRQSGLRHSLSMRL